MRSTHTCCSQRGFVYYLSPEGPPTYQSHKRFSRQSHKATNMQTFLSLPRNSLGIVMGRDNPWKGKIYMRKELLLRIPVTGVTLSTVPQCLTTDQRKRFPASTRLDVYLLFWLTSLAGLVWPRTRSERGKTRWLELLPRLDKKTKIETKNNFHTDSL